MKRTTLPHGKIPFSSVRDSMVKDIVMKLNENIVYLNKRISELDKRIATLEKRKRIATSENGKDEESYGNV